MRLLSLLILPITLTLATNRIFRDLGNPTCQKCLASVEFLCTGPIESIQFNNCFCSVGHKVWPALKGCLTDQTNQCERYKESILGYYGSHCFAWKKDEKYEICVEKSQGDALLMSVADSFCTAFVTPTTSATSTMADAGGSTAATTPTTTTATTAVSTEKTTTSESTATTDGPSTTVTPGVTTPALTTGGSPTTTAATSTSSGAAGRLSLTNKSGAGFISFILGLTLQIL